MARPPKMNDEKVQQLKAICRMKPTLEDCAAYLDLDPSTIEKWIRRKHGVSFSVFRDQNMVHTRFRIVREILKQCDQGNMTALIWASKNLCGWKDNHDLPADPDGDGTITLRYSIPARKTEGA